MASTTDTRLRSSEIPRRSAWTLVTAAALVLVMAFVRANVVSDPMDPERQIARQVGMFQYPHALAAGLTIARALEEFSGKHPQAMTPRLASLILLGILSTTAIGMPILLASMRRRLLEGRAPFLRIGAIVGFLLAGGWALSLFPATILQRQGRATLASNQGIQRVRDEMINSMTEISLVARGYARRPAGKNGGGGTFDGFALPSRLQRTTRATYEVSAQETTLVITGRLLIDPVSVFTAAPELPAPDWTVRCIITPSRDPKFTYTGRFE